MAVKAPQHDVVVIGGGPAGHTAATYLARYRRDVLMIDAGASRARWIPKSHNCPGFPVGISGPDLLAKFAAQSERYGVRRVEARVERIEHGEGGFLITSSDGEHAASSVVLATGVVDVLPDIDGIEQAIASGVVRICAICDAYEARDERIAVLGRNREVIGHARFLRTFSRDVTLLLPEETADASPAPVDDSGIKILTGVVSIGCRDRECVAVTADGKEHGFDTLYPVLGSHAQSELAVALGAKIDDKKELIVDRDGMTSVPGLYAVGDVVHALNQISVAVGHAAIAATAAHRRLPSNYA